MPRKIKGETFLSPKEAATRLGVHPNTIRQWAKSEDLKTNGNIEFFVDPINGRRYLKLDDVETLIDKFLKLKK